MALTTISGEIQSQPLNDNFSNLNQRINDIFINVKDPVYGALGDGVTDDTNSFQSAIDDITTFGIIYVPSGNFLVTKASLDVTGKNIYWICQGQINGAYSKDDLPGGYAESLGPDYLLIEKPNPQETDYTTVNYYRNADYNAASTGGITNNLRVETVVGANVGTAANRKGEWVITAVADNYSLNGKAVGITGATRRRSGAGAVWAGQFNTIDYNSPTSTYVSRAIEANIQADGSDTQNMRSVIDVVAHNLNASGYTGSDNIGYGFRCYADTADFKVGLQIGGSGSGNIIDGIVNSSSGSGSGYVDDSSRTGRAIYLKGTGNIGIDLSQGTWSISGIRMSSDTKIELTSNGSHYFIYNSSNGYIEFFAGGSRRGYINMAGSDHAL